MAGLRPIGSAQLPDANEPSRCARHFNGSYPPDDCLVALVKHNGMSSIALTNTKWHQGTRIPKCGSWG